MHFYNPQIWFHVKSARQKNHEKSTLWDNMIMHSWQHWKKNRLTSPIRSWSTSHRNKSPRSLLPLRPISTWQWTCMKKNGDGISSRRRSPLWRMIDHYSKRCPFCYEYYDFVVCDVKCFIRSSYDYDGLLRQEKSFSFILEFAAFFVQLEATSRMTTIRK